MALRYISHSLIITFRNHGKNELYLSAAFLNYCSCDS